MQLTSLEIYGFKSFADRTKLIFDKGVTGIVGPNGCGKSNIVDSIRWVLGEQRSSSLRSDKMENVIFNGTRSRKKANFAEVSLTFENTKNLLPTEYSTVAVTRKLYRSGESEYYINGVACRLKDIQDLFMDTGITSDSYAIIELRMVDEILTNKDNERRRFLEEAAGISKYKLRKKQTLKKLEETDGDLARVEDLLFEIDKNLKSLEKQARRTQRYFELKEQYKQVSSQYAYLQMGSIRERQKQIQVLEQHLGDQLTGVQAGLARKEAEMQEFKRELVDQERLLAEAQAGLNKHLRHIQSVETEKSIKNERLKYLQQRELAVRNQIETEKGQRERNSQALTQLQEALLRAEREAQAQRQKEEGLQRELAQLREQERVQQRELQAQEAAQREAEQEVQQLTRDREIQKVQSASLEAELQRTREDRSRREGDLDAFALRARELEADCQRLEAETADLEARREQHQADVEEAENQVTALKDAVYRTNRLLDARQNEESLTRSLVENLEGFPASVKFLKKNAQWMKDAPLLSDVFQAPEEYKVAFENYLDPYLSYYVVRSRQDALQSVRLLAESSKGRAFFFILDELEHYKPATPLLFTQAVAALDVVETAPEYRKLAAYLLDRVYLVQDERDLQEDMQEEVLFLSRSGGMSRRRFVMGGGSLGLFEGKRLGRARNLEALEKEIGRLGKQLSGEKAALDSAQRLLDELRRQNFAPQAEALRRQLSEKQRDLSVLQSREQEHAEFLASAGRHAERLGQELERIQGALAESEPRLRLQLESLQQSASRLAALRAETRELSEQIADLAQAFNQEHIRLIHLQNQLDNLRRDIESREEALDAFAATQQKFQQELEGVRRDIEALVSANLQEDAEILALYEQKKSREEQVDRLEQRVGHFKNEIQRQDEALAAQRRQREELMRRQAELRENASEVRLELHSLRDRMSVEFQVDIASLSEQELFEKPLAEYSLGDIEERLHKVRAQVQGYGEINPLAVEAFREMKERFDFIQAQKDDLQAAKQSLLDTIAEIDQTAQEKFSQTFTAVRENFQQVFRSLFSEDDSCDIELTDPANPLESDISIIARPKGKRPLTIKQLSGGEKTLTAVALLFAIYLIKPAPFCIFDEVDAPLDDANIDKFNRIIRDFSANSQFIIVTHNKRTMASTHVMYGITMETPGVSMPAPVSLAELNLG
jgi:chromosome segregation protein